MNFLRNGVGGAGLIIWCETPLSRLVTERRQAGEKTYGSLMVSCLSQACLRYRTEGCWKGHVWEERTHQCTFSGAVMRKENGGEAMCMHMCYACTSQSTQSWSFLQVELAALASLSNCFSNYSLVSVMSPNKIIVDDDGNDGDGGKLRCVDGLVLW